MKLVPKLRAAQLELAAVLHLEAGEVGLELRLRRGGLALPGRQPRHRAAQQQHRKHDQSSDKIYSKGILGAAHWDLVIISICK